jgi:hypothetical protein
MSHAPKITISRCARRLSSAAWMYDVWWDDGDDTGHGRGGWARTRLGARFAARRVAR